jgi:Tn3 transposase DDE domain
VNARHGNEPGVSFYTHISDQFGPFYTKVIAATAKSPDGYDAIGILPDGKPNIVKADDPPFRPETSTMKGRRPRAV